MVAESNPIDAMRFQDPRLIRPGGTVIQNLMGARKRRATVVRQPLPFRKPTHLRIPITDDERRNSWEASFDFRHLKGLGHSHGFRDGPPQFIADLVIGLHVGVDEPKGFARGAGSEFDVKPSFCC